MAATQTKRQLVIIGGAEDKEGDCQICVSLYDVLVAQKPELSL